jgi:hypothetical protein
MRDFPTAPASVTGIMPEAGRRIYVVPQAESIPEIHCTFNMIACTNA